MRRTLILIIISGLFLAGYFFLPQFFGEILKKTFREGTGCAVKLNHPRISLISLSASIENISVICSGETDEEGFFADKVSIQVDWESLWDRTVRISSLKVEGASTKSLISESAFLQTLKFILKKPERKNPGSADRGWHVWVPHVEVLGKKSQPSMLFGGRDFYISGESVEFSSEDPVDSPFTPAVLKAKATEAHLISGPIKLSLGNLQLEAEAGGGKLNFSKATLRHFEHLLEVKGYIDTRNDIFDLKYSGDIGLDQFGEWIGSKSLGIVRFNGLVLDNIYNPRIESSLDFLMQDKQNNNCTVNGSLAKLNYQDLGVKFENLKIENIASAEEFILDLSDGVSFKNSKSLELNFESNPLHACLPEYASKLLKVLGKGTNAIELNLVNKQAISNFDLNISKNGYESLKLRLDHEAGRYEVATTFSLLGQENNVSKFKLDYTGENTVRFENLEISKMPLFVVVDLVSVLKGGASKISDSLNRNGLLQSALTFDGAGELNLKEISLSNFQGKGELVNQGVSISSIEFDLIDKNANIEVLETKSQIPLISLVSKDNRLSGMVKLENVDLSKIFILPPDYTEQFRSFSLTGNFAGEASLPTFSGNASLKTSSQPNLVDAQLTVDKNSIRAKLFAISNTILGEITQKFDMPQSEIHIDIGKLSLKELPYIESYLQENIYVSGKLSYSGSIFSLLDSEGDVLLNVELPESLVMFQPNSPVHLNLKNGTIKLDDLRLPLPLSLKGYLNKGNGWNLDIAGDVPLASLVKNIEAMESMQGLVSIESQVRGDIFAPEIFGEATIKDSSFNLVLGDAILGAEGIKGTINFSGDRIIIESISGEVADGEFMLRGQAENVFSRDDRVVNLIYEGNNMKIEPYDGLFIDLSTKLSFGISKNIPTVLRGAVEIEEAVYENAINLDTLIRAVTDFIGKGLWANRRIGTPSKLSGVLTDLHITSKGGMLLDTNVVQAELLGDLHLSADIVNPFIDGRISVLDGGFKVNQTDFQILSGELLFSHYLSSMNPDITLTSEGSLRNRSGDDTKVFLSLGGTLKNTKLILTSEGDSSSRDLAKQLGVGGGGNQLKLVDEKVSNIGFRELLSPSSDLTILERVSGLTGFDDVRVETGVSVRTGEFVPQVFASRPLPANFRATISSELSGDKASGAKLEYRLDDSYSIFTSWRSQAVTSASQTGSGNIGAGFQYRRTFKGFGFLPDSIKSSSQAGLDE